MNLVILVHGYNKSASDMRPLQSHLQHMGYEAVSVSLPLRFRTLAECVALFEQKIGAMTELSRAANVYLTGE